MHAWHADAPCEAAYELNRCGCMRAHLAVASYAALGRAVGVSPQVAVVHDEGQVVRSGSSRMRASHAVRPHLADDLW